MISIQKLMINNIPALHIVQMNKNKHPLPTVIYYHGFNGEKESSLTIAYKIAEKGFRVILPDSMLHGDRKENISQMEFELAFWDIVFQNISEIKVIKHFLEEKKLAIPNRIGIGGTSMGGITSYGALKKYRWIKAATVLMGTPNLISYAKNLIEAFNKSNEQKISINKTNELIEKLKTYDITLHPELLDHRPLFMWHGDKDNIVPIQHSELFYKEIRDQYSVKDNIKFIIENDRTHHISKLAIEETANWFHINL